VGCICLYFLFPGVEVNNLGQQTNEVLAVGSDTVHAQDTSIFGHEGGSRTDVGIPTCQSAKVEGDKHHAAETVLEFIQAPCETSDKDHSADLSATTLVTPESNKIITCDMEVVCAGNGESETIGVQEAAVVAGHEEAIVDLNGTTKHGLGLASCGSESVTGVQEPASVADPESMHMADHKVDSGAPGSVLQGNSFHPTNPLLPSPSFFSVHIQRI
jgi:hypothetical protein